MMSSREQTVRIVVITVSPLQERSIALVRV